MFNRLKFEDIEPIRDYVLQIEKMIGCSDTFVKFRWILWVDCE